MIRINKEYKPKQEKNSNTLPSKLIEKLIKHCTKPDDVVLDIFSGGFTTQFAALKLGRKAWGCEINASACERYFPKLVAFDKHYSKPEDIIGFKRSDKLENQGKKITANEKKEINDYFLSLGTKTKKEKINETSAKFKRGYFSILRILDNA